MGNLQKKIEILSNVAIIVVAVLIGGTLINRYAFSTPTNKPKIENDALKKGVQLPLLDVDWNKSEKTLILVISTSCHFCAESIPFYQRIVKQKIGRGDLKLIAVLPQPKEESQDYLKEREILVDDVKQANLSNIFVKGTPTLILVDRNGLVVESWVGKLPPEKEVEVISHFLEGTP